MENRCNVQYLRTWWTCSGICNRSFAVGESVTPRKAAIRYVITTDFGRKRSRFSRIPRLLSFYLIFNIREDYRNREKIVKYFNMVSSWKFILVNSCSETINVCDPFKKECWWDKFYMKMKNKVFLAEESRFSDIFYGFYSKIFLSLLNHFGQSHKTYLRY